MGTPGRLAAAIVVLAGLPAVAAAHDPGATRFDAPVPPGLVFAGAGATVAATAAWMGRAGAVPTATRTVATVPAGVVRAARWVAGAAFAVAVAVAVLAGLVGPRAAADNLATVFVWPVWLKGVALVAVVAGNPWRTLSPWRGVHALLERLEGDDVGLGAYPERWGYWPAVVGFVATVGIVENLTAVPGSPRLTAGLVSLYAVAMAVGGIAFGRAWFRHADFFEVFYRLLGRVAVVRSDQREDGYAVGVRAPWVACARPAATAGAVVLVVATVYTVSFDGFTNTPEYRRLLFVTRDAVEAGALAGVWLYLAGLAGFVATFVGTTALAERLGAGPGGVVEPARAFAPSVLPIAAAYELAHNYPYVVRNLARAVELAVHAPSGEAGVAVLGWLSLPAFWGSQVALVVAGHVVAVAAAHAVAVGRYDRLPRARRAHLPLVVVMVGYTVASLWIVSRPVVAG